MWPQPGRDSLNAPPSPSDQVTGGHDDNELDALQRHRAAYRARATAEAQQRSAQYDTREARAGPSELPFVPLRRASVTGMTAAAKARVADVTEALVYRGTPIYSDWLPAMFAALRVQHTILCTILNSSLYPRETEIRRRLSENADPGAYSKQVGAPRASGVAPDADKAPSACASIPARRPSTASLARRPSTAGGRRSSMSGPRAHGGAPAPESSAEEHWARKPGTLGAREPAFFRSCI